jgi:hypothetical protein
MPDELFHDCWTPLTLHGPTVVNLQLLEWTLSATPEQEWIDSFKNAPTTQQGSGAYVLSNSRPGIHGRQVTWNVGEDDQIDAARNVRQRVEYANSRYAEILADRAAERERQAESPREEQAAIDAAQRRLDEARGQE